MRTVVTGHMTGRDAPGPWLRSLRGEQLPNLIVFGVCFCLIAGALILTPPGPESACIKLGSIPLPTVCTLKNLTGLSCPGCGLVRSMSALAHGELAASLGYHRLGWLVSAYILAQFVYRLGMLAVPAWRKRLEPAERYFKFGLITLAVLLALNWIVSLLV
jgi:hypothetical protein